MHVQMWCDPSMAFLLTSFMPGMVSFVVVGKAYEHHKVLDSLLIQLQKITYSELL